MSESFEAEGCIVQVSNQSRDILFKKRHPQRNAKQSSRPILTKIFDFCQQLATFDNLAVTLINEPSSLTILQTGLVTLVS